MCCIRYLGMNDFQLMDAMTLREYRIRMKAYRLKELDEEYKIALLAWQHNQVKATKKNGKKFEPVYKTFKDFFDVDKYEKKIKGQKVNHKKPEGIAARYRDYMRNKR